jgi:cytochrome bd-type quinol oxidase subunit 2
MQRTSVTTGILLIALGVASFVLTAAQSATALIPAGFVGILVALGIVARHEKLRRDAMHAAAAVGLIALAGSVSGFLTLFPLLAGREVVRPAAVISQSLMFLIAAVFVGLAVKSFIDARRKREP